ncbi:ATP-binding protein [Paracoccus sp. (in: a-proteobacteria)]|uniref:ATP-binding protein n=1 Tax=Paracoccus sp. TaxID=267 RepID=UPI0026DF2209|nr:ATP-binding protein [Paracoccus sp. (in: a-proteobacteria)]MDO5370981.1 ATP-binding protein [Paracoccus sp. (in: a-proteobacteria)]
MSMRRKPRRAETGLSLQSSGAGPFPVRGDRHLLGRVLANLIENGLRHVSPGGRITVTLEREAGRRFFPSVMMAPASPNTKAPTSCAHFTGWNEAGPVTAATLAMASLPPSRRFTTRNCRLAMPGLLVRIAFPL